MQLAYAYAGCFTDSTPHILTTSLGPLSSLYSCLEQCDSFGLTACGATAASSRTAAGPLCIGGAWSDAWRTAPPSTQCTNKCPDGGTCGGDGLVSIYQVGWGNTTINIPNSTPHTPPAEVSARDQSVAWSFAACYKPPPSSLSSILLTESTPDDCLATCAARNIQNCVIGFAGRVCYGDAVDATWQVVDPLQCDAPCRFPSAKGYERCGGMRDDGVRVSVYHQGAAKTINTTAVVVPNTTSPPPPSSSAAPQITEPPSTSSKSVSPAVIAIIVLLIVLLLSLAAYFIYRRRQPSRPPSLPPSKRTTWGLPKFYPSYTYTNPALIKPPPPALRSAGSIESFGSSVTLSEDPMVLKPGERGHVAPWEA